MWASSGTVAGGVGWHGHVETAVVGGSKVAQQQFLGVLQPEDVETHGGNQSPAGVFPILNLADHVERHTGGDRAWNGNEVDVAHDLDGDVDHRCVSIATGIACSKGSRELVLNHNGHVIESRCNTGGRERKRSVTFTVGGRNTEALVGVAVVPNVVHRSTADVGVVSHIGDLRVEGHRVVHFDDVSRAFCLNHHFGDDTTQLRYLRWWGGRHRRINKGVVRTAGWCLREEVEVNNKFVGIRAEVGRHHDGDVKGARGVVERGLSHIDGALFREQRDRDEGRVVDHGREVHGVKDIAEEAG